MSMLKQVALVAVALLMVVSTVSVAAADVPLSPNATQVGNFVLYKNSTTGAIDNLSFVNDNTEAVIASSVSAVGNLVMSSNLSNFNSDNLKTVGNLTVFTAGNENTLMMATQSLGNQNASITLNLNAPVSKLNLTPTQQLYLEKNAGQKPANFLANNMYKIAVNGTSFIIFSSVNVSVSNGSHSITYTKSGNYLYNPVLVGISPASALKDTIEKEIQSHDGQKFSYNATTGMVNGRFVSFNMNTTTGVISHYTDVAHNATVFTSIQATGNGTIGYNNPNPSFFSGQPVVAGGVFYSANSTVVYQMHDNPAMVQNVYLSNGTLSYTVAPGLNMSVYRPQVKDVEHENLNSTALNYTGVSLGSQYDVHASSSIVLIHNSTFRSSLFVHGADVSVNNTTRTISINTTGVAHVTFVAPPGLQELEHPVASAVQYAINHGRLAALVVLGSAGNYSSNLSVSYNSTMQVNVQNVSNGSITVKVGSSNHEGTNFAIFVPNNVISNNSQITLKFDGQSISLSGSMNSVVNATSTTHASFYYVNASGGTLVIVHVPHFSQHTITLSSASAGTGTSGTPGLPQNTGLYLALGAFVAIAAVAGIVLARRKK